MFGNSLKNKIHFEYSGFQFPVKYALMSSLAMNLLSLSIPILTLQIYDRILKTGHSGTLYVLCSGVAVAILFEVAIRIIQSYNIMFSGAVFEHRLVIHFMEQFLSKNKNHKKDQDMGVFLNKLTAINKLKEIHSGQAMSDIIDMPFVILFLCLIAFFSAWLILVPVSVLILIVANNSLISRKTKKSLIIQEKSQKKRYGFIIDTLLGIHSVKSCAWEESFIRGFESWQSDATLSSYNMASLSTLIYDEGVSAAQLTTILMATLGAPLVLEGQLTVGSLTACVMLSGRIMQMVQRMMGLSIRLEDLKQAYLEIKPYLKTTAQAEPFCTLNKNGTIIFKQVDILNHRKERWVSDLSFELHAGNSLLIESDSQALDQALIELIFGQKPVISGEISVNGVSPFDIDANEISSQIAYLPTQGQLFQGSIEDNMSCFGKIPKSRVFELAGELGIEKEINKLFAGFDTEIEGINLDFIPPGIRQRIAICRALGENPKIIVFDHSEHSIDPEGYKIFLGFLKKIKNHSTIIFFSKDPNIEKMCDQKLIIQNGDWQIIRKNTNLIGE